MLWIIVHNIKDEEIYVNIGQATSMKRYGEFTYINFADGEYIEAKETPDTIFMLAKTERFYQSL